MTTNDNNLQHGSVLTDILVYSAIGCCSYLLLIICGDMPAISSQHLTTPESIIAVLLLFNGVGLSLRFVNRRMSASYPAWIKKRSRMFTFLAIAAAALLCSNYLLLVATKVIGHSPRPMALAWRGAGALLGVWLIELLAVSLFLINRFYADIAEHRRRARQLEDASAKAQYAALQSQLNPHFLFNSLNTLVAEIEYNPAGAAEFTRNLADIYRYILDCHEKQSVSLNEEIRFAQTYLQLQRVRLGDCIQLETKLDSSEGYMQLPPLTLQLLTENVIKHNIVNTANPATIKLWCEENDDSPWLAVSNTLTPKPVIGTSGHGLQNLSKRCRLLCGRDIRIIADNNTFTVKIPIIYN